MARPKEYPDELVQRGVRLVLESGRPIAHIASDLGMHAETLRKKVRQDSRPQRRAPDKSSRGRGRPAEPLDSDFTGIVPGVVPSPSPDGLEWLNHAEPARLRASLENRCRGNPPTEGSNPSPSAAVAPCRSSRGTDTEAAPGGCSSVDAPRPWPRSRSACRAPMA